MKTNDLYVVLKPSTATGSLGDVPWQSNSYLAHEDGLSFSSDLENALVFITSDQAYKALKTVRQEGYRIGTLAEATKFAHHLAVQQTAAYAEIIWQRKMVETRFPPAPSNEPWTLAEIMAHDG